MAEQQPQSIVDRTIDRIHADNQLKEAGFVMSSPHCHPHYEIFYIESGHSSYFVGSGVYELHAGDLLIMPPDVFHFTRYPATCRRSNVFFREGDLTDEIRALMPGGRRFFDEPRILQVPEGYREQIAGLFSGMAREEKISDERTPLLLRAMLHELLLLCGRECAYLDGMPEDIHTTDMPIVKAARFMSSHYMDDISTADIAAEAGYSPNYLTRKFREAAGIGVHEYLTFIRLQRAALELVSTDHTVTEIAFRCGFSDGNYFKDAFKKKYGVTPREYRK